MTVNLNSHITPAGLILKHAHDLIFPSFYLADWIFVVQMLCKRERSSLRCLQQDSNASTGGRILR